MFYPSGTTRSHPICEVVFASALSQPPRAPDDGLLLRMSILIVDAAAHDLRLLKTILSGEQGWNVVTAQSGAEALRALAKGGVGLVLADLMMPGLGGIELCRRMQTCPDVRGTP